MALSILTNPVSIFAQGSVNRATNNLEKSIRQLSTGLRINSASDDPAGFAMAEKLRTQISGFRIATQNVQDAQSMLQIANEAMLPITGLISDMQSTALRALGASAEDRATFQNHIKDLQSEINRISTMTEFNGKLLLNGNAAGKAIGSANWLSGQVTGNTTNGTYTVGNFAIGASANAQYEIVLKNKDGAADVTGTTLLKDLAGMEDMLADGRNTITIYANGKSNDIVLDNGMTVAGLNDALNSSIQTLYGNSAANQSIFDDTTNKIIYQAAVVGSNSYMSIGGSDGIAQILGISNIATRAAIDPLVKVNITPAGGTAKQYVVNNGYVRDAIDGVSIKVDYSQLIDITITAAGVSTPAFTQPDLQTLTVSNTAPTVQYGPNAGQTMSFAIGAINTTTLGLDSFDVMTDIGATNAMETAKKATAVAVKQMSDVGFKLNSMDNILNNLAVARENTVAAESRIRDLDMAEATSIYASRQVILQAANAMLAQANLIPSYALQLLRQA